MCFLKNKKQNKKNKNKVLQSFIIELQKCKKNMLRTFHPLLLTQAADLGQE
jgi:hypothetical protein